MQPIVLDFDNSVGSLPNEIRMPLAKWQEAIRFGCSQRKLEEFASVLQPVLRDGQRPVFLGSGDFHHISLLLVRQAVARQPCRVIVFDNHPDNMRFPFGVHCGSWVSHVASLPGVTHVDVVGITSLDVSAAHLWENRLRPLWSDRLTYWCLNTSIVWARRFGLDSAFRVFDSADALIEAFDLMVRRSPSPTYLSIDKDVLHPDVVRTNWDQGALLEAHLIAALGALMPELVGMDVTGEVSAHTYSTPWKRWLSARDGQPTLTAEQVASWQIDHHRVNINLLATLLME
jgi:arginase family enzyme